MDYYIFNENGDLDDVIHFTPSELAEYKAAHPNQEIISAVDMIDNIEEDFIDDIDDDYDDDDDF